MDQENKEAKHYAPVGDDKHVLPTGNGQHQPTHFTGTLTVKVRRNGQHPLHDMQENRAHTWAMVMI